jgi:hypothetical protein
MRGVTLYGNCYRSYPGASELPPAYRSAFSANQIPPLKAKRRRSDGECRRIEKVYAGGFYSQFDMVRVSIPATITVCCSIRVESRGCRCSSVHDFSLSIIDKLNLTLGTFPYLCL